MDTTNQEDSLYPAIFGEHQIRRVWHQERWFYAVVDVIKALQEYATSREASNYWNKLSQRLREEGATELLTICQQLKMLAADGKMRSTVCADNEGMLRLVQSIPSPKAEPFKRWLAEVGNDRLEELGNPELGFQEWRRRAVNSYMAQGYSHEWAVIRIDVITSRNDLTEEWFVRGIDQKDYAILTNRLHMGIFGLSVQEHMGLKHYPVTRKGRRVVYTGELREGMTATELVLTNFGQEAARAQHIDNDSHGFDEITRDIDVAGIMASAAREALEQHTGQRIPSAINAIPQSNTLWGDQLPDITS